MDQMNLKKFKRENWEGATYEVFIQINQVVTEEKLFETKGLCMDTQRTIHHMELKGIYLSELKY